jgi:hypothetical protein
MAKKGQTTKKEKPTIVEVPTVQTEDSNVEGVSTYTTSIKIENLDNVEIPINLSTITIEELINYEKACSMVCSRYEIKARLSGEDNTKFQEFLEYHQRIVREMEARVVSICKNK